MSESGGLTVGIIGAGIAGLSAAIAMRRIGWDVELYEKSAFKNEVGAGIVTGCNATKVLRSWGADFDAWQATDNLQVRMPNGKTLGPQHQEYFGDMQARYGERWLLFHRQDLHDGLRRMTQDTTITSAPPARIHLSAEVVSLDVDAGIIQLASGMTVRKDLVVVADGIHTKFQEAVVGRPNPVIRTGKSAYRCLVPLDACLKDPLTAPLFENQAPGLFGPNIQHHHTICGSYPIRNNTLLSVAYIHPTKPQELEKLDWNSPASLDDIEESTAEFHPAIREIPRKVTNPNSGTDVVCYSLIVRKEIETFVKGRTVLIGDAAHPMMTFHAQGAGMAIESAGALEVFFRGIGSTSNVPEMLKLFDKFRHGRCVATQIMSNGMHGALSNPAILERITRFYKGDLPPKDTKPWGEGFRDWFFAYDVFEEASKFLRNTTDNVETPPISQVEAPPKQNSAVVKTEAPSSAALVPASGNKRYWGSWSTWMEQVISGSVSMVGRLLRFTGLRPQAARRLDAEP